MPEQIKANPTGRTAFDNMSNTDLEIMIAHYGMLIRYYTAKRKEAVEELNQRIWHNEEDFWGLYRKEADDAKEKVVSSLTLSKDEIEYAPSGLIGERLEMKLKEAVRRGNPKDGRVVVYIEYEETNNDTRKR